MRYFLVGYHNRLVAKPKKDLQRAVLPRELSNRGLVIKKDPTYVVLNILVRNVIIISATYDCFS